MRTRTRWVLLLWLGLAAAGGTWLWMLLAHGLSARDQPTAVEVWLARGLRRVAVPGTARAARNPVPPSADILAEARAHFADHCASCHGNDGRGRTEIGRNLYPRAPDMTLPETQSLTDGEIFHIIENGLRLTGMPAWGRMTAEDTQETWKLVHFIRHLPRITPEELQEMEDLNPKSRKDLEEEDAARDFLEGRAAAPDKH